MRRLMLLALTSGCAALAHAEDASWNATLRARWTSTHVTDSGPLAAAHATGLAVSAPSAAVLEAGLQGSVPLGPLRFSADLLARSERPEGERSQGRLGINEAYLAGGANGWQWSAGKKVLSWDVGYGFRPNDVVQQESRRRLISLPLEGRPLLMGEYFTADRAWTLVAVNPTAHRDATDAGEPALAARLYQRDGSIDWHGFARLGTRTGASVGAALAWVVSDAVELHASARYLRRDDSVAYVNPGAPLASRNPWLHQQTGPARQWLIGGSWTHAAQVSLLLEAWRDDTAPSAANWRGWAAHNAELAHLARAGAPAQAVAGNQAWQASAFNAASTLHRNTLFARLSWTHDNWQPAIDVLYHPQDGGCMLTAALAWQGDRLKLETGLRHHTGPASALIRQLPERTQGYVMASWAY